MDVPRVLGLGRLDVVYLLRSEIDLQVALRLIADWGPLVDAAVRRRPLFQGEPFTLPGHEEDTDS